MIELSYDGTWISIHFPYHPSLVDKARSVTGSWFDRSRKVWKAPVTSYDEVRDTFSFIRVKKGDDLKIIEALSDTITEEDASQIKPVQYAYITTPMEHQKVMSTACLKSKYFALFCEMGTGKTKGILDAVTHHVRHHGVKRVLVLCPKNVIYTWTDEEVPKHTKLRAVAVTGSKQKRLKALLLARQNISRLYVTNYETLQSTPEIMAISWDMIILDEAHKIKNGQTKTAKLCHKLADKTEYRYILTGTPVANTYEDIWSLFRFLDRGIALHRMFLPFRNRYFRDIGQDFPKYVLRMNTQDELFKKIAGLSLAYKKAECMDLPDKIYQTRTVELTKPQQKAYKDLIDSLRAELGDGTEVKVTSTLPLITKLMQVCSGFIYLGDGKAHRFKENPKLEAAVEAVEEILSESPENKVVIWAYYRPNLIDLERALDKYNPLCFSGKTPNSLREHIKKTFQTDPAFRIMIAQQKAGGLGMNLTKGTHVLYYSQDYSIIDRAQSEDRTHRKGTTRNILYIDLVASHPSMSVSADRKVLSALRGKKKAADMLMDFIEKER